ncbi:MAG: hypothetical protein IPK97_06940 [Ahniella sp.]|nr:hypothetical protein [Ahniella sp.]
MNGSQNAPISNLKVTRWLMSFLALVVLSAQALADPDRLAKAIASAESGKIEALREQSTGIVPELIHELKRRADQGQDPNDPWRSRRLQKSLAALGDAASRTAIQAKLQSTSLYEMSYAFRDATEVGGNDMIRAIAERLNDPTEGGRPRGPSGEIDTDVGIAAPRHHAVVALSTLITDETAPRIDLQRITYEEHQVEKWKAWWAANKSRYQSSR